MKVTVCHDLSDRALIYDVEPGVLSDIFTFLELGNAVALVNGKFAEPETVVSDDDVVFIRQVPKGIVTGLLIVAGVALLAGAAYAGYEVYKMRKQMEKYKEGLSSFGDSVTNLPNVKGANNVRALDRSIPMIIGEARIAPYVLSEGKNNVYGIIGNMERAFPYVIGYGPLVIRKCFSNGVEIATFSGDTPQEGVVYAPNVERGYLYMSQSGLENIDSLFDFMKYTFVNLDVGDQLLKADDPNYKDLTYVLPENTATAEVVLMFNGLRKYNSSGNDVAHTLSMTFEYSKDGGTTWLGFPVIDGSRTKTGDYSITKNTTYQFRITQTLSLPFSVTGSLTDPIQIKVICNSNAKSGALEDVYVQSIQTKVYDPQASADANNYVFLPVIDEDIAEKCCIAGFSAGAKTSADEDAFRSFAFIVSGVARTWSGSAWTATKTPTKNPAAWLLEVLTSSIHPQSQISDSDIDLDSFGELYEYCTDEELEVSMVVLEGEPKEDIIQKLCDICFSTLYKNLDGKISVATDKPKENAIAIINTQNCFTFTNKKDLTQQVDGLRVTFVNEDTDYEQDAYEVMRPDVTKDANSKIRALSVDGITKYDQIVKYAWRLMAIESARPKVTTVEIGNEGVYYTPLSKVLVQHPSLKNGLGSAEIKNVVMSGADIIGLDLYEPVAYDSGESSGFGVVIQCVSESYSSVLAREYTAEDNGLVKTITFAVPIDTTTAPVIPHAGDILSYGLLNSGAFDTITSEMMITNMSQTERGWRLDLVDYNEEIYEYGEIPEYTPNITKTQITKYVPTSVPAASLPDVVDAVTEAEKPMTISGVPVFADRETCIAECTLNEVHYLLYQDVADWEIVTINEDLTTTSFLTGSGVLNDMCAYDGKIFVSDDDGLYYIEDGELIQVYDNGIDSIQSDGADLYAIKDGKFCRFGDTYENYTIYTMADEEYRDAFYYDGDYFCFGNTDGHYGELYKLTEGTFVLFASEPGGQKLTCPTVIPTGLYFLAPGVGIYKLEGGALYLIRSIEGSTFLCSYKNKLAYSSFKSIYIYDTITESPTRLAYLRTQSYSNPIFSGVEYGDYLVVIGQFDGMLDYGSYFYCVAEGNGSSPENPLYYILASSSVGKKVLFYSKEVNEQDIRDGFSSTTTRRVYSEDLSSTSEINEPFILLSSTGVGRPVFVKKDISSGVVTIERPYLFGAPVPIDETVRNYGKIRLAGSTLFAAVTDGHIYRLEDDGLVQHTQSPDGYNVASYRSGRFYCARDYAVFELKPDGTVLAIENAVSETPIVELFDYGDYLVWSPTYTSPETGTMYAAFVNYPGNVNVSQNITLSIPAEFIIGATKTFRRLKSYDGEPLILVPPSGAMFEGLNLAELYGKYSYVILERVSADLFTIVELNDEYKYSDEIRVVRTKSTVEYHINDTVTIPAGYSYFDYTVPERFNPARCFTTITASDPTAHWTFTVLGASLKAVPTYDNIRVSIQNDGASQDVTINVHCIVYSANVVYNTLILENGDIVTTDRGDSIAMAVINED